MRFEDDRSETIRHQAFIPTSLSSSSRWQLGPSSRKMGAPVLLAHDRHDASRETLANVEQPVSPRDFLTRLCRAVAHLGSGPSAEHRLFPEVTQPSDEMPRPFVDGAPLDGWWVAFRVGSDVSNAVFIGEDDVSASAWTLWEAASEAAALARFVKFAACPHCDREARLGPAPHQLTLICPLTDQQVRRVFV